MSNHEETVMDAVQQLANESQEEHENDEIEEIDQPAEQDQSEDEGQEEKPKKEWVEFTPEQQAKFNDVYKQVKMSDARNQMLTKMLEEQQKQLDDLKGRFSQTDQAEVERVLKTRLQEAREEGDVDKEFKIMGEINEFLSSQKSKQAEKTKETKQDIPDDPETRYVVALAQETDDSGQPLRPWLSDKHPRYKSMLTQATIIAAELEAEGETADITKVMKRLDERMNKKPNPRSPDPMGGNLTTSKNSNNIKPKLSAQEKAIAAKLGMSEADYLDGKLNYGARR